MEENFKVHGVYCWCNFGGYEVELHPSGDAARVRSNLGEDCIGQVSEWLEIEYIPAEEEEEEDLIPVIDPNGLNIPLNLVMRV